MSSHNSKHIFKGGIEDATGKIIEDAYNHVLDGKHWSACEYDKDMAFGGFFTGQFTQLAPTKGGWAGNSNSTPMGLAISLYKDDIVSMWKSLTDNKILTSDNIISIADDWVKRIGTDNFKKEYNKWTEAPCNRDDKVDNNYWERKTNYLVECIKYSSNLTYGLSKIVSDNDALYKSLKTNNSAPLTDTTSWEKVSYDPAITYNTGDTCYVKLKNSYLAESFKAVATTSSNPISGYYDNPPYSLGYRDNVWRFINFINYQVNAFIEYINSNYKNN